MKQLTFEEFKSDFDYIINCTFKEECSTLSIGDKDALMRSDKERTALAMYNKYIAAKSSNIGWYNISF